MRRRIERASRQPPPPRRAADSRPAVPVAAPAPGRTAKGRLRPREPGPPRAARPRRERGGRPTRLRLGADVAPVNLAIRVRRPLDDRLADIIHGLRGQGVRTSKVELIEMLLWELPDDDLPGCVSACASSGTGRRAAPARLWRPSSPRRGVGGLPGTTALVPQRPPAGSRGPGRQMNRLREAGARRRGLREAVAHRVLEGRGEDAGRRCPPAVRSIVCVQIVSAPGMTRSKLKLMSPRSSLTGRRFADVVPRRRREDPAADRAGRGRADRLGLELEAVLALGLGTAHALRQSPGSPRTGCR